jgi:hypothetical protein
MLKWSLVWAGWRPCFQLLIQCSHLLLRSRHSKLGFAQNVCLALRRLCCRIRLSRPNAHGNNYCFSISFQKWKPGKIGGSCEQLSASFCVLEEKRNHIFGIIRSPRGRLSRKLEVISMASRPSAENRVSPCAAPGGRSRRRRWRVRPGSARRRPSAVERSGGD